MRQSMLFAMRDLGQTHPEYVVGLPPLDWRKQTSKQSETPKLSPYGYSLLENGHATARNRPKLALDTSPRASSLHEEDDHSQKDAVIVKRRVSAGTATP